jgi:hypothetical protein
MLWPAQPLALAARIRLDLLPQVRAARAVARIGGRRDDALKLKLNGELPQVSAVVGEMRSVANAAVCGQSLVQRRLALGSTTRLAPAAAAKQKNTLL